ncbi:MAG: UDP-2,3-diacylglucosamine diphosphatase [Flavobacteriales bacterium]|jgi:UDP-2,3-diacylglucosamine hydrolase
MALYFASDFHLGAPNYEDSKAREQSLVRWLEYISKDATEIYLLGDVFDFWFEYKRVIPKGFSRLFGKLAELSDKGIKLHFFLGNHDMWVKSYFHEEFNMETHTDPLTKTFFGQRYYLGHGDGLGPGDKGYKFIKRILRSPLCQWAFARLHPNFGIRIAHFFSNKSRKGSVKDKRYNGKDKEWLYLYVKEMQAVNPHDFYVFGHRHLPLNLEADGARYFNLGEWLSHQTFLRVDEGEIQFLRWNGEHSEAFTSPHD